MLETTAWWVWPIILFVFTFFLGILAVMAGVGGGVLFVPLVSGFFPFHLDYVRGAGLFVALTGALAAGPGLLRRGLANLRLTMPLALIASTCSIAGALVGLALPTSITQTLLGVTILFISFIMITSKRVEFPKVEEGDRISQVLGIYGIYYEESMDREIEWKVHRTLPSMILFAFIGLIAGMFGLGAGWANVPVLNLMMGAPLKIAAGTSKFLLSITDTSAAWVYLNNGSVIPLITIPSCLGIMLGSYVGVRVLAKASPKMVRSIVIVVLIFAGLRSLLKGLGIWV